MSLEVTSIFGKTQEETEAVGKVVSSQYDRKFKMEEERTITFKAMNKLVLSIFPEKVKEWQLATTFDIRDGGRLSKIIADSDIFGTAVRLFKSLILSEYSEPDLGSVEDRAELLYAVDVMMNHLVDEHIVMRWMQNGVPDGSAIDDIREMVVDVEDYRTVMGLFNRYVKSADALFYIGGTAY